MLLSILCFALGPHCVHSCASDRSVVFGVISGRVDVEYYWWMDHYAKLGGAYFAISLDENVNKNFFFTFWILL
jgi:hypothetical protein